MSILVIIIISIIKALFNVVRFDVQGRLAFFVLYLYRHRACRSYWTAYLNAFICLHSSFCCRYGERLQYVFVASVSHFLVVIINGRVC